MIPIDIEAIRPDPAEVAAEQAKFKAHEDARADQRAVWALADVLVPPDIQEFGRRHGIPQLTDEIWRVAFCAGWRAALTHQTGREG